MTEFGPESNAAPSRWHSVFVRLVAVMLVTAFSLLVLVAVFFGIILSPRASVPFGRVTSDYAHLLASTSPDLETAKRAGARLGFEVRYEGPDGAWTTAATLPTVGQMREREASGGRHDSDYYIIAAPNGGTYLFSWPVARQMLTVHVELVAMLLVFVLAVVLTAHALLRRLLRPLRWLSDGVARLGEGQLDVVVPQRTRDEFGALTQSFNTMVRRVREMIQSRDQLLLDVSHELRSPLTRMKVALELSPESPQRSRMASDIAEMEAMITELLELERLRDGRGIRLTREDLVPILHEVAASFADRPPGVRVTTSAPEILLDLDAEKIRTVLRNLLDNAVKYSLADSAAIEVTAAITAEGAAESAAPGGRGAVTIRVTDDGPGIPPADLSSLFEPFFRVDRSRSKKTGGYGLGLSISKRIVEAHGGSIAVATPAAPDGRGASFVVKLDLPS